MFSTWLDVVGRRLSGIEPWELFRVDNSCCQGMPLGVPEKDAASNPAEQSLVLSAAPF